MLSYYLVPAPRYCILPEAQSTLSMRKLGCSASSALMGECYGFLGARSAQRIGGGVEFAALQAV